MTQSNISLHLIQQLKQSTNTAAVHEMSVPVRSHYKGGHPVHRCADHKCDNE